MEHPREKEMFRVERHMLYASHASAVTHWVQQKDAAAAKKAAKAKKKPNPTYQRVSSSVVGAATAICPLASKASMLCSEEASLASSRVGMA